MAYKSINIVSHACLWCRDVLLCIILSSVLQYPPSLHKQLNVKVMPVKNIAFFKSSSVYICGFNIEFINVMPFQGYD